MKKANKVAIAAAIGTASVIVILGMSCNVSIPKGATAVSPFNSTRYLGKWYEIARMDFKYEKHLNNVTATYSLREDGAIQVDNRGFDTTKNQWKQSIGKAKFVKDKNTGRLKVSFFGPFYAGYNVIAVDADYQYALVVGDNLKYMWILSRTTHIPETVKADYLAQAEKLGYSIENLVWTQHDKEEA
ncbi:apolipoprotein D and lipocalin family protein [Filimonas lacunae]|uniref:Outer membrane lipoprotein Blc n=1 Tax=Filimonas lacunae TaxID=477680 RepID=A0A173MFI4_9BACT|nr:lipocalin family protein [Filimonas lacunae]BAV06201.1 outer membrane lipoprotein Blc [Filimonas lacunae]SIT25244.1 apolipoprotein D and lipocalin family protein [Filimonas lacunae]